MLCHEYGWTVEQCFNNTQGQIELLVKAIQKRQMSELEMQAKLHGAEMKKESSKSMNVDKESDWNRLKHGRSNIVG